MVLYNLTGNSCVSNYISLYYSCKGGVSLPVQNYLELSFVAYRKLSVERKIWRKIMRKKDMFRIGAIVFSVAVIGISVFANQSSGTVIKAKAETLEYAQKSVDSLSLLDNSDGVRADRDAVNLAEVGTTSVTYTAKKKSKIIDYQVVDSQVPSVKIDKASLACKTGGKVEPKIMVSDPVDGAFEKMDKMPDAKVDESNQIGRALYYGSGWYVVSTSKVDTSKEGEYDARVTTADKHGNTVIVDFVITVSGDGTKVNDKTKKEVNGEVVDSKDEVIVKSVSNTVSNNTPSNSTASSGGTSASEPATSNGSAVNSSSSNSNSSSNNGNDGGTSSSDDGYVFTPPTPDSNGMIFYDKVTEEDRQHCNHEWVEFNMPVTVPPEYEFIDHPQEGHYETYEVVPGYYESYTKDADGNVIPIEDTWVEPVMGERYVIDKEAWTEQVLVKEGYSYTKFLGYSCKLCGAQQRVNS